MIVRFTSTGNVMEHQLSFVAALAGLSYRNIEITPDVPLPRWQEIPMYAWPSLFGVGHPIPIEAMPDDPKDDGKWTPADGRRLPGSHCTCGLAIKDEMEWGVHTMGRVQPGGSGSAWFDPDQVERIWRCAECHQPVGAQHKALCHDSGMVTMAGERKVVLDAPTHILPCGHPPTAAGTCGIPWCDGIARVRDDGMGGDCQRQRDIRCSDCHQPFGSQHRPSCHRQGMVTSASDYDYMGAWIQPESGHDQRRCSFTDQMANLAPGRAAGQGAATRPADAGTGHSASEGAKLPYPDGKAER